MTNQEKSQESKKRKGPPLWFIILFVIILVIGAIGIGYGFTHPNDYKNSGVFTFDAVSAGVSFKYDFAPDLISLLETGSSAPYSFYLGSGVGFPPMGLKLDMNGVLKGTPTGTSDSKFQVCVKDVGGRSACRTYSMTVGPKSGKTLTTSPAPTSNTNVISAAGFSGTWEGTAIEIMHGPEGAYYVGCKIEVLQQFNLTQNGNKLSGTLTGANMKTTSCDPHIDFSIGTKFPPESLTGAVDGATARFYLGTPPGQQGTNGGSAIDYTATLTGNTLDVKSVTCQSPDPRCTGEVTDLGLSAPGAPPTPGHYETILWYSSEFTATRTK